MHISHQTVTSGSPPLLKTHIRPTLPPLAMTSTKSHKEIANPANHTTLPCRPSSHIGLEIDPIILCISRPIAPTPPPGPRSAADSPARPEAFGSLPRDMFSVPSSARPRFGRRRGPPSDRSPTQQARGPVKRSLKAPNHQQRAVGIACFDQSGQSRTPLRAHPLPAPDNQVGELPLNGCGAPPPSGILGSSATRTVQALGLKSAPSVVSTRCTRRSVHSSVFRVGRMVRVHRPAGLRSRYRMVLRDDRVHLRDPAFSRSSHEGSAG